MARSTAPLLTILVALVASFISIYTKQPQAFLFATLSTSNVTGPETPESRPSVYNRLNDVTYIGSSVSGVEHFQNIFYAEDTSGLNRFAPPVPYSPTPGSVIDATQAGAWCPQGTGAILPFTSKVVNVSENCLSLRIARPHNAKKDTKLPVLVWLHGGGHALGSASDVPYQPDGLVKQASADGQPIIFVGVNYRVGIFGFASSKALLEARESNAGLKDQRLAFEWTRDNIAAFGGDPQNITAIGQSVGASDIGLHLTSYGGTNGVPFQKAIMMSGAPGLNFNINTDLVKNNTASIASKAGCIVDEDSQSPETLARLRQAPLQTIMDLSVSAARASRPPFGEGFFYPTVDGDLIPERPSILTRAGRFVKGVPVIASWVTNDGAWYASPTTASDDEVLGSFGLWLFNLSQDTKSKLLELYPLSDFEHMVRPGYDHPISAQYYRAAQLNRDIWFTCPVLDFAWQYVKKGGPKSSNFRLYEHNSTRFTPVYEMMSVPMWRVAHLSDIPYVFNGHVEANGDNSAAQIELSKILSSSLARFAAVANPTGSESGVTQWPLAFYATHQDWQQDSPQDFSLELFRGPDDVGPVSIGRDTTRSETSAREEAVLDEMLFERCGFINGEPVREEIGV